MDLIMVLYIRRFLRKNKCRQKKVSHMVAFGGRRLCMSKKYKIKLEKILNRKGKNKMLNLEQFKTEFSDIYRSVFNEGYQAGMAAGKALSRSTPVRKAEEIPTPEERHAEKWRTSPDIRIEFQGDKEAFLAYAKAEDAGRIKICGKPPK